jgi:hypothetical protein
MFVLFFFDQKSWMNLQWRFEITILIFEELSYPLSYTILWLLISFQLNCFINFRLGRCVVQMTRKGKRFTSEGWVG